MAGSFGFEKHKYPVSIRIGEAVLLPEARKADRDTLIVADGYSCREQIRQGAHRDALHLAQVIQMAIRSSARPYVGAVEDRHFNEGEIR
jgi:Fe-S oxidoreductase